MTAETNQQTKQGSVIGGWICLVLGAAFMFWTLFSFILYLPLFLAAFVLGIVAIAQRHLWHGIPILLLSVVIPLVLGVGLGAYRASHIFEKAITAQNADSSSVTGKSSTAISSQPSTQPIGHSHEDLYIRDNLLLYDFRAKYMESILDGRVPGVKFKLRNKGNRTLDRVKVVVFFKDSSGAVIAEEEYSPVLVSEYNFSGDNKPLKPGYIWQMESDKFYSAKSVPSEWKEGVAEAKIKEISFAK
jgi:hypothetical protein